MMQRAREQFRQQLQGAGLLPRGGGAARGPPSGPYDVRLLQALLSSGLFPNVVAVYRPASAGPARSSAKAAARAARSAHWRLRATTRRRGVFVFAPSALASSNSATEPRRCRRIGRGYAYQQTRSTSGELDSDSARVKA